MMPNFCFAFNIKPGFQHQTMLHYDELSILGEEKSLQIFIGGSQRYLIHLIIVRFLAGNF